MVEDLTIPLMKKTGLSRTWRSDRGRRIDRRTDHAPVMGAAGLCHGGDAGHPYIKICIAAPSASSIIRPVLMIDFEALNPG